MLEVISAYKQRRYASQRHLGQQSRGSPELARDWFNPSIAHISDHERPHWVVVRRDGSERRTRAADALSEVAEILASFDYLLQFCRISVTTPRTIPPVRGVATHRGDPTTTPTAFRGTRQTTPLERIAVHRVHAVRRETHLPLGHTVLTVEQADRRQRGIVSSIRGRRRSNLALRNGLGPFTDWSASS